MKPRHTYRGVVLRHAQPAMHPRATAPAALTTAARIRVGREVAGRGGKGITVVTGLALDAAQLEQLATRFKRLCGAGGAVKNGRIEIQGEHRDRLVAELCRLGFEAKRAGG